jgi:hypothetical protein
VRRLFNLATLDKIELEKKSVRSFTFVACDDHPRAIRNDSSPKQKTSQSMTPGVNLIKPIVDSTRELEPLDDDHPLQTTAFLGCCRLFLPVLDALGVAFKPAKADVGGNVERLSKKEKEFENVRAFGLCVFFCVATTTRQRASVFARRPY